MPGSATVRTSTRSPPDASGNGTVVVIAATQEIVEVIEVGRNATGMGVRTRR